MIDCDNSPISDEFIEKWRNELSPEGLERLLREQRERPPLQMLDSAIRNNPNRFRQDAEQQAKNTATAAFGNSLVFVVNSTGAFKTLNKDIKLFNIASLNSECL